MDRRNKHGDKPAARSSQSRETPQEKRQRIERIFGLLEEAYSDARLALHFETPLDF
jgi:hypothetical protein